MDDGKAALDEGSVVRFIMVVDKVQNKTPSFSYPPVLYPKPPIAHSPRPTYRRAREQVHGYLSSLPGWLSTDKILVNAAVPVPKSEHGHCQWSSCGRSHPGPLPTETHREPYRRPYTTLHRTPIFIRTTDL